jgi:hypothetical protein
MGLARPTFPHPPLRPRITMVACPQREDRPGPYLRSPTYSGRNQGEIEGDCVINDPNKSAREGCVVWNFFL